MSVVDWNFTRPLHSLCTVASGHRYAKSHEWAATGDSSLTKVGISNYAQVKQCTVQILDFNRILIFVPGKIRRYCLC